MFEGVGSYRFDVAQKCSNPGSDLGFEHIVWTIKSLLIHVKNLSFSAKYFILHHPIAESD